MNIDPAGLLGPGGAGGIGGMKLPGGGIGPVKGSGG